MSLGEGKNYDIDLPLMSNGKILNKYEGMSINDFNIGTTLGKLFKIILTTHIINKIE